MENSSRLHNPGEMQLVKSLCDLFVKLGVEASDIGVICTYRYHTDVLRIMLPEGTEVSTIDRYQGREKDIIILSFVWTAESGEKKNSDLLSDRKRINVAITRAKKKLVFVGCIQSLKRYPTISSLITAIPNDSLTVVPRSFDFSTI
ncbi:hypothetical protein AB6A40_008367 [Gnathostoma spinigerum]|uniref:DNA2/NAM7 helicase-like C-terminal domain-containing protein n=1 Tax=Gnathostoma spinigerum TaxID=75299 RepID=A0ABD6EX55_9BILA